MEISFDKVRLCATLGLHQQEEQMAKKTETLHLRLAPELRTQLEALALELDRPLAWVVRRALEAYLVKEEKKDA